MLTTVMKKMGATLPMALERIALSASVTSLTRMDDVSLSDVDTADEATFTTITFSLVPRPLKKATRRRMKEKRRLKPEMEMAVERPVLKAGSSVPFGFNPKCIAALKFKNLVKRTAALKKRTMPKYMFGSHAIADDLSALGGESAFTGTPKRRGGEVMASVRCLKGCVQVIFYEDDLAGDDPFDDFNSWFVFVDANCNCPVFADQKYSVECYSDDAKFEVLFFQ